MKSTFTITLTPEQCASMLEDPNKIYKYISYDMRGFTYNFEGTPAEYKADKEKRLADHKESQIGWLKYLPCDF